MPVSDITLSNDTILEGLPTNTLVGTFDIITTPPVLGTIELSLLDNANGAFKLDGLNLLIDNELLIDFDENPTLEITVVAARCTADAFIKSFTINILDDNSLAPIITNVEPFASKGQTLICVTGRFFTDGGSTTLLVDGEEYPYVEDTLTDTNLCFNILGSSTVGPSIPECSNKFDCGIFEFTICNGNTDNEQNPLCDSDIFMRYKNDQSPSLTLGNTNCVTKPIVTTYRDADSPISGFNSDSINWEPNPNTVYVQVRVKYDFRFDTTLGGETTLDGRSILDGDLVWLTNQGDTNENGIWLAKTGSWEYQFPVDENVFVDLGGYAYDQNIGDVSRDIITRVNIDWDKVGIYTIEYYYLSTECVLSKATRRIRIFKENASISPVNTFAITDYKIFNGFDKDLIDNIIPGGSDNVCCPGFVTLESGLYIKKDGTVVFLADQSMGDNKLTDLAYAINQNDAVSLQQAIEQISFIPKIAAVYTAGENIGTNMAVRIDNDGKAYLASASDISHVNNIIGISNSDSLTGEDVIVTSKGTVSNYTTLVQGSEYWLAENGALSLTPPTSGFSQVIGVATSCENFLINPYIPVVI